MAKGQKRSNREIRKPKQAKTDNPLGSQVKPAANTSSGKTKN